MSDFAHRQYDDGGAPESGAARDWQQVRHRLRAELGDRVFDSWLRPLSLVSVERPTATLSVPTKFMRDWVEKNYAARLITAWSRVDSSIERVEFLLNGKALPPSQPSAAPAAPNGPNGVRAQAPDHGFQPAPFRQNGAENALAGEAADFGGPGEASASAPRASSSGSEERDGLDPKYTFDQFVVGKSNELAHAAARRVAESPTVPFNPLFLHGGTGLGKTHLMHAIAWEIQRRDPDKRVLFLSAEKFMYRFVNAIRHHSTMAFKEQFRNVDVLLIDDFQFLGGKTTTQEEFFHTFNELVDRNRQIIISADCSPNDLENIEERIRSRLSWGLVADIHPTDYELRLGILQAKARHAAAVYGDIEVPGAVLDFLARMISTNVRELEGALHRVLAHAALVGRAISVDMAGEVLKSIIRSHSRRVTVEEIQRKVAEFFEIKFQDMQSPRRARVVARPRQIAMYLAKQLTTRSLPDIGRRFGGRDHSTVIHAVKTIEELRKSDPLIDEAVEKLRRQLE